MGLPQGLGLHTCFPTAGWCRGLPGPKALPSLPAASGPACLPPGKWSPTHGEGRVGAPTQTSACAGEDVGGTTFNFQFYTFHH